MAAGSRLWRCAAPAVTAALVAVAVLNAPGAAGGSEPNLERHHFRLSAGSITPLLAPQLRSAAARPYAGKGVAFHPSGKRVPKRLKKLAPRTTLSRTGVSAIEPTLGVDSKGRAFMIAVHPEQLPQLPSDTLRSTDGGRTWEIVTPTVGGQRLHRASSDPYLHVDEDTDRVFMADFMPACTDLSFTDDGGDSWTNAPSPCGLGDHQSMFTGPPVTSQTRGYENVVYYCAIDGFITASAASGCIKSLDGGLTFLRTGNAPFRDPATELPGSPICHGGLLGHGTASPDGSVFLPRIWCGQPYVAVSRDEGLTWQRVRVSDVGAASGGANHDHDAAVAVDDRGNVFYAWASPDGFPYLSVSRDSGKTWSDPIEIRPPGVKTATLLALDADAKGHLAFAFYGTDTSGYDAPNGWHGYVMVTSDGLSKDPLFYSARVNPQDDPLEGTCDTSTCRAAREFIDVAISPDGSVWAPFVDACFDGICDEGGLDAGVVFTPAVGEGVVGIMRGTPFGK